MGRLYVSVVFECARHACRYYNWRTSVWSDLQVCRDLSPLLHGLEACVSSNYYPPLFESGKHCCHRDVYLMLTITAYHNDTVYSIKCPDPPNASHVAERSAQGWREQCRTLDPDTGVQMCASICQGGCESSLSCSGPID